MGTEDFVSIAKAVRAMVLTPKDKRHVCERLAVELAERNVRFDWPTFYMACGVWREADGMPKARMPKGVSNLALLAKGKPNG